MSKRLNVKLQLQTPKYSLGGYYAKTEIGLGYLTSTFSSG